MELVDFHLKKGNLLQWTFRLKSWPSNRFDQSLIKEEQDMMRMKREKSGFQEELSLIINQTLKKSWLTRKGSLEWLSKREIQLNWLKKNSNKQWRTSALKSKWMSNNTKSLRVLHFTIKFKFYTVRLFGYIQRIWKFTTDRQRWTFNSMESFVPSYTP